MTRILRLMLCVPLLACGADGPSGDSATRTEPSATEPGIAVSGYARVGVRHTF